MHRSTYEVEHAINGRIKNDSQSSTWETEVLSDLSVELNIADFLNVVNDTHRSVLPDDVLSVFGEEKPVNGHYYGETLYSYRDLNAPPESVHRSSIQDGQCDNYR